MESEEPAEFGFGLPEEAVDALLSEVDDWDEWQLEGLMSEASFRAEERRAAAPEPDPMATGAEGMLGALFSQGEQMTWGIDEPLTGADLAVWLDEDEF